MPEFVSAFPPLCTHKFNNDLNNCPMVVVALEPLMALVEPAVTDCTCISTGTTYRLRQQYKIAYFSISTETLVARTENWSVYSRSRYGDSSL